MSLRRTLAAVVALVLVLSLSLCASAQVNLVNTYELDAYTASLDRYTNNLIIYSGESNAYVLCAPDGTKLTTEPYISMSVLETAIQVAVEEGLNVFGLIDSTGKSIMPMQYGDVNYISDRWQLGVVLEEATSDNYDYKNWGGDKFYLVSRYDVYFDGVLVGDLARTAYRNAYAYGAYLYVCDADSNYTYYDCTLTASEYQSNFASNSEYETRDGEVWHRGSNQKAFAEGCTLTSADVELDAYILGGRILDLQGNQLGVVEYVYDYMEEYRGEYARVRLNSKYGLIDRTGHEVLPCEYESMPYGETFFEGGYQVVVKDGKLGYVNLAGEVTCDFTYAESAVESAYLMPATSVVDLSGEVIILSAAAGELPERYADVSISYVNGCPLIVAENAAGQVGALDLYGNVLIAMDGIYDDTYDLQVSYDGSVVLGYGTDGCYRVYLFEQDDVVPAVAAAEEAPVAEAPAAEEASTEEAPAEATDGSWTCGCGSVNDGKFCPECGAAKPEANVCPGCGAVPAEGAKFCSECGTSLSAN